MFLRKNNLPCLNGVACIWQVFKLFKEKSCISHYGQLFN